MMVDQINWRTGEVQLYVLYSRLWHSHTISVVMVQLKAYAPYNTFSNPVLAPVTKRDWKPACRESYLATVEIKVYEHLAWGVPGTENLVDSQKLQYAALEFGEDLLTEASESAGQPLVSSLENHL